MQSKGFKRKVENHKGEDNEVKWTAGRKKWKTKVEDIEKKWRKIESGREKENEIVKTESGRVLDEN